jgi:hypothetical protein
MERLLLRDASVEQEEIPLANKKATGYGIVITFQVSRAKCN